MPRLDHVLTGIKRSQASKAQPPKPRLPITPAILRRLKTVWCVNPTHPDLVMLWAAACTGFFGFLRAGEFTIQSPQSYDPEVHLSLSDLALDSHSAPSVVRLRIKQSKTVTDPFRAGVDVFLGATGDDLCPVQALIAYLAVRPAEPGPLFIFQSGTPLSRSALICHLQSALRTVGINSSPYTGHSFRIGAATTAAACGLEDSLIQFLFFYFYFLIVTKRSE